MDFVALNIPVADGAQAEILVAELAEFPFESFESGSDVLKAYIPQERLADCKTEVDALLARYGVSGRYISIEAQNWNALWEQNFPASDIEGRLRQSHRLRHIVAQGIPLISQQRCLSRYYYLGIYSA